MAAMISIHQALNNSVEHNFYEQRGGNTYTERGKDCSTSAGWSVRGPEEHKSWGSHSSNSADEGPREHHPPGLLEENTSDIALGEQGIKITPLSLVNKQLLISLSEGYWDEGVTKKLYPKIESCSKL